MMESITEIAGKYIIYNSDLRILICRLEKHYISPGVEKDGIPWNCGVLNHFRGSEHNGITRALAYYVKRINDP